jgi:hypothetical protein
MPVTIVAIVEAIMDGAVTMLRPAIPVVRPMAAQVTAAAVMAEVADTAAAEAINAADHGDLTNAFYACAATLLDSF